MNSQLVIEIGGQKYKLSKQIGEGSNGQIFKAYNINTDQQVAIKLQPVLTLIEENSLKQLKKENLKYNANIIDYQKQYEIQNRSTQVIIMELGDGTFGTLIEKNVKLISAETRLVFLYEIASGVLELHNLGLIHRDLNPFNIIYKKQSNNNYQLKVCDTGSMRENNCEMKTKNVGTINYMAPEIIQNQKYDEKVDIWSLGMICYQMFKGETMFECVYLNDLKGDIQFLKQKGLNQYIDELDCMQELKELLKKMILIESKNRLQAKDLVTEIQKLLDQVKEQQIDVDDQPLTQSFNEGQRQDFALIFEKYSSQVFFVEDISIADAENIDGEKRNDTPNQNENFSIIYTKFEKLMIEIIQSQKTNLKFLKDLNSEFSMLRNGGLNNQVKALRQFEEQYKKEINIQKKQQGNLQLSLQHQFQVQKKQKLEKIIQSIKILQSRTEELKQQLANCEQQIGISDSQEFDIVFQSNLNDEEKKLYQYEQELIKLTLEEDISPQFISEIKQKQQDYEELNINLGDVLKKQDKYKKSLCQHKQVFLLCRCYVLLHQSFQMKNYGQGGFSEIVKNEEIINKQANLLLFGKSTQENLNQIWDLLENQIKSTINLKQKGYQISGVKLEQRNEKTIIRKI